MIEAAKQPYVLLGGGCTLSRYPGKTVYKEN